MTDNHDIDRLDDADVLAVMAYVDGEMPDAARAAFEARVATDDALRAAVTREHALRGQLGAHYDAVLDEPVPDALLDLLGPMPADVAANGAPPALRLVSTPSPAPTAAVAPRAPRRADFLRSWQAWGGMAASLVLGVTLGARLLGAGPEAAPGTTVLVADAHGTLTAAGTLRTALEQQSGGAATRGDDSVAIGLTFRNHAHDYCRTFAVDTASGIACKTDGQWTVANLERAAGAASAPTGGETYRMASSALSPTMLQAIDALRDGDTLDAAGEAAARAHGWSR